MPDLPSGTVTFLFTDIEGSTALWERDRSAMASAVERHLNVLREAVAAHDGALFKVVGDGTQIAFPTADAALGAALAAQRTLLARSWPDPPGPLRVRMALHAGQAHPHEGDYLAAPLNRLARLLGVAQGGQVLLTEVVAQLAQDTLPPGASLRDLGEVRLRDLDRHEHVFMLIHPDLPGDIPTLLAADERLRGFPATLTPFVGREALVSAITDLLRTSGVRLLTLTGPGGTGKTRLAMRVGAGLANEYKEGVVFVDLAPLRDPALVLSAIATALGLREGSGRSLEDIVQVYLRERQLLLLLDNFEHLLPAASVLTELLTARPGVKALVTSREPLHLRGEREYPVPALTLPATADIGDLATLETNEAISLFVDRAQAVKPDFALTSETARAVAEICARLDGLPLAIELAAARVKVLPPSALLARLEQRLPLLIGGTRDAPERQRTLRDAIAWSHDLLSQDEQMLFRGLGVFVGGWTLDAAEAVVHVDGDLNILEGLASLVDKSLVRLDEAGAEPRYMMLETIHEFAWEQLVGSGEEHTVAKAHAGYMLGVAEQCDEAMLTPAQTAWHQRVEAELGNLRAALSWLEQAGDAERMQTLAARCWWALVDRASAREAREWLDRALALPERGSPETRAAALISAGFTALVQGDLQALGVFAEAGLELSRRAGLPFNSGLALFMLAQAASEHGEYERAATIGEEAIALLRQAGDRRWLAMALNDIGLLTAFSGNQERADQLHEEGIALSRAIGSTWHLAIALSDQGLEAEARGDQHAALDRYRESLAMLRDIDAKWYFAHPLAGIAGIATITDRADIAARLMGAASILHEMQGTKAFNTARESNARTIARARAALGDEIFDREFALGRRLPVVEALQQALSVADDLRRSGSGHEPQA